MGSQEDGVAMVERLEGRAMLTARAEVVLFERPPEPSYQVGFEAADRLPDGRVVAIANEIDRGYVLARYLPDGRLDPSFGDGGVVSAVYLWKGSLVGLAAAADGSLLHLYRSIPPNSRSGPVRATLVRRLPDGQIDERFASGGSRRVSLGEGAVVRQMAVQADGRIVVAGTLEGRRTAFVVRRLRPDGRADRTFGDGGTITVPVPRRLTHGDLSLDALRIDGEGRLLLVGSDYRDKGITVAGGSRLIVARLLRDGFPDDTYGRRDGLSTPPIRAETVRGGSVEQASVAEGALTVAVHDGIRPSLIRLRSDGELDRRFGRDGRVGVGRPTEVGSDAAVFAYGNGDAVIALRKLTSPQDPFDGDVLLLRVGGTGRVDRAFGNGGSAVIDVRDTDNPIAFELDQDGLTLFGSTRVQPLYPSLFAITVG